MNALPLLTRAVLLQALLMQAAPFAYAQTGTVVGVDANSVNDVGIEQEAGSGAEQNATIEADAETVVESEQTVHTEDEQTVEQTCESASGSQLCFQDTAPQSITEVTQEIDASSENILGIDQQAGSGSVQHADVTGSASTIVTANQTVTTDTIIDIFQDCSLHTGVCVQRALPEVLTLATQLIAATALNTLEVIQESQSGALQDANVDLAAQVQVNASQVVRPRTFLSLTQTCALEVGMCIQRALPIIRNAVMQVIDASADNDASILQDGAAVQQAIANLDATTTIDAQQIVDAQATIAMIQRCGVGRGLCLRTDAAGNPFYVFNDGEETQSGAYVGTLDETPLAQEYSRKTVGTVASGICGGAITCSMVERLLLWLFGPEEQPASSTASNDDSQSTDMTSARRGHETNVLGASIRFLAGKLGDDADLAPAGFGGSEAAAGPDAHGIICSMQKRLTARERADGVWDWTAQELSLQTGLPEESIAAMLRDPELCPKQIAEAQESPTVMFFPVAPDGPISNNALWNKCIRGAYIGLEDVRANGDRTDDDLPRTCTSYRTGDSWYHPDLHIHFTWNRDTGYLDLPAGYVPMVRAEL